MHENEGHRCAGCAAERCPDEQVPTDPPLRGRRLMTTAVAFFLAPLVLAVVGALCGGGNADAQLAGALAGLLLGTISSVLWARVFVAKKEDA
jgi:hypothetical protein